MKLRFWLFFAVLAAILLAFQSYITLNIPRWDDFHGILIPVDILINGETVAEKIEILFSQNNEHRIAVDRLVLLLLTYLSPSGIAEMKTLALSGTLLLVALGALFVQTGRKLKLSYIQLLPIPIVLFSTHVWEILQSLMVPYQVFAVLFMSFISFYLASKGKSIAILILISTIAIFCHGNGLLTIPIVGLILILNARYKDLLIWAIFSISIVAFYFTNYVTPPWNNNVSPLENPLASILYFFEFIGSFTLASINLSESLNTSVLAKALPTIFGLLLFGGFLFIFYKNYLKGSKLKTNLEKLKNNELDTFLIACLMFLFATGLMMALKRTGFPMNSRYVINSQLVFIIVYLFISSKIQSKKLNIAVLTTSILYYCLCLFNYTAISLSVKEAAIVDVYNWKNNRIWLSQYTDYTQTYHLNEVLDKTYNKGLYKFPENIFDNLNEAMVSSDTTSLDINYDGKVLSVATQDTERGLFKNNIQKYIMLKSAKSTYIMHFDYHKNGLGSILEEKDYFNNNINTRIYTELIPKGIYQIALVQFIEGKLVIIPTNQTLTNNNDTTPIRI
ncbi:hypothetical protein SAMN06298216_0446 [Spirosomataceae bacterium TFI 002]|nr:hypothetical protein SAMN06298216_0446 [Spirosomataceae bacterium TFI 002]